MDASLSTPRGRAVLVASMARSLLRDDELMTLVHDSGPSHAYLWWDSQVPIENGDIVHYFPTALGVVLEAVVSP